MPGFVEPVGHVLGWAVLHLTWQTALAAGLVWMLQQVARDAPPRWRYRMAWLAFVSLPLLPLATAGLVLFGAQAEGVVRVPGDLVVGAPVSTLSLFDALTVAVSWIGLAWGVVILAAAVRLAGGLAVARNLVSRGREPSDGHRIAIQQLSRRMGVRAELRVSAEVRVPTVLGIRRPTVLVPATLSTTDVDELLPLLAHELAHVRRGDPLENSIQVLVRSLLFFHPAARWLARTISVERERACDELAAAVLADRRRYAASLARFGLTRVPARTRALAVDSAPILDRVRRLAAPPACLSRTGRIRVVAGAVLALSLVVAAGCTGIAAAAHAAQATLGRTAPAEYTIQATDPAGNFTVSIRDGRAVAATVDGEPLATEQLVQERDAVTLNPGGAHRPFTVHLSPDGGIRWSPRTP